MEKLALIFFEGNDSKITLFEKDNGKLKLVKAESVSASMAFAEKTAQTAITDNMGQVEMINYESINEEAAFNNSFVQSLHKILSSEDLKNIKFIPILSEPGIYFHKIEEEQDIVNLKATFSEEAKKQPVEIVKIANNSKLAVYASGKTNYLMALNVLAKMNSLKYLKISSVKCAEISLAGLVAQKENLKDNEVSLILYIGKEYSKLIFMKGKKILHIGSTVSAGKNTSNPYYIIMSKILLEMENAPIHTLDRVIICGEDSSEALFSSLEHSYPDAKVSKLEIANFNVPGSNHLKYSISAFSVNIAVAEEYIEEEKTGVKGLNLLPPFIIEEQKPFGWESYLLFFLIFAVVFGFTKLILENNSRLGRLDNEIARLRKVQAENQEMSDRLNSQKSKIENYTKSKTVLESYSKQRGTLSSAMKKISDYADSKRTIWFTDLTLDKKGTLKFSGYALYRSLLTELSYSYKDALLSGIIYAPLRDYKSYKFSLSTNIDNSGAQK